MEPAKFAESLDSITGSKDVSRSIVELLQITKIEDLPFRLRETASAKSLQSILSACDASGIKNIEFDISLMRGFDYYTDIVFEVFDNDPENNRSMFGGGRYNGLVGQFGVEAVPTVGFGMGDVTFRDFLTTHSLIPRLSSSVDVALLVRDDGLAAAQKVAGELREMGVNTALDSSGKKIDKQLRAARKSGVKHVIFVGEEDAKEERYTLKNLHNNEENKHSIHRIVSLVKDSRK